MRIERSAALLKEAGIDGAHPLRLSITYNTAGNHRKLAQAVAAMWQPLGVEVELRGMAWEAYQSARAAGDVTIARLSLFGEYAEPSALLKQLRCNDPNNEVGYCDPRYDALIEQAEATLDSAERHQLYQAAELMLDAAQPLLPLYHYSQVRLVDPTLGGLPSRSLKGLIATKDLYFQPLERSE